MNSLFERLLSTPEVMEALDDHHFIKAMLRFEAALARAQAGAGLIPQAAAMSIAGTCRVELFDVPKLVREAGQTRCLTEPLLTSLRETVGLFNPQAADFVHFGCSDMDLADSAMMLVTRDALALIEADLSQAIQTLLTLAVRHASDLMPGCQTDDVSSFGLLCSQWAAPLVRARERLRLAAETALSLQLGSALGGPQVQTPELLALMATELELRTPSSCGPSQRDDWLALGCALALLVASLAGVAHDLSFMSQAEASEPAEAQGLYKLIQAGAQRVPQRLVVLLGNLAQGQQSDPAHWQASLAEWQALLLSSHGAMRALQQALSGLQVQPQRLLAQLDARRSAAGSREAVVRLRQEQAQAASARTHTNLQALGLASDSAAS